MVPAPLPNTEVSSLGLLGLPVASPVLAELRPMLGSSDLCLRRTRAAVGAPAVTVAGIGAGTFPKEVCRKNRAIIKSAEIHLLHKTSANELKYSSTFYM